MSARRARRCLPQRDYADIVLVDIKEGLPQGKALDINQMGAVLGYEPNVTGLERLRADCRIPMSS